MEAASGGRHESERHILAPNGTHTQRCWWQTTRLLLPKPMLYGSYPLATRRRMCQRKSWMMTKKSHPCRSWIYSSSSSLTSQTLKTTPPPPTLPPPPPPDPFPKNVGHDFCWGESALLFQTDRCGGPNRHACLFIFKVNAHTSLHNSAIPMASAIVQTQQLARLVITRRTDLFALQIIIEKARGSEKTP